jgi:two-component system OmpR family sensor kinase
VIASLRARLIAALLLLATFGMLLLAGITYAEQRSFMLQRVDEQVRAAPMAIVGALQDRGVDVADRHGGDGRSGPGPGGPGRDGGVPVGTYGELRAADGAVLGRVVLAFGENTNVTMPRLPANLPPNKPVTVGDYRVIAQPARFGTEIVIAAVPLHETNRTLNRLLLVEGLVIAGVLVLLGAAALVVVRVGLLPLDRIGHTAGRIAGGDLSHRVTTTDPRTEVGRLGISLNAMLDRLEQAFSDKEASEERLRRFLADASHELRTPLASIRGYGELYRMGALGDEPEVRRAMGRIEDEAARMGVLVEDLLTLARLDQIADAPHVPLELEPLVHDAVDDARAMAPDRDVNLVTDGHHTVVGDAHQLRQVLGNLVRNALVHTPDGTPIDISLTGTAAGVRLEVRDHGPGLPTDDSGALFERFWRAERGRERGKGGAGLGLAIVAAIVDAHRGRVRARNAQDGGASFVVELPASSQPSPT